MTNVVWKAFQLTSYKAILHIYKVKLKFIGNNKYIDDKKHEFAHKVGS